MRCILPIFNDSFMTISARLFLLKNIFKSML